MTNKDILPEKDLVEKAATSKIFEYLLLGKESKVQADIAKKQYKKLDDTYEFVKNNFKKKPLKKYSKSDRIYNSY